MFFDEEELKTLSVAVPLCEKCGLYKNCLTPKQEVVGKGERRILIIGDHPTEQDDVSGRLFSGGIAHSLRQMVAKDGYDLDVDTWMLTSIICRGRATPEEIRYCRSNVFKEIKRLQPTTIILLGYPSILSVIGHLWHENIGNTQRWFGLQIPSRELNAWICPVENPIRFSQEDSSVTGKNLFKKQFMSAYEIVGRPHKEIKEFPLTLLYDPREAIPYLEKYILSGKPVAVDYETTTIKPDAECAEIVSAGVCWRGKETIAFPWHEAIIPTWKKLVEQVPIIGANLKFEDRWTRAKCGTSIKKPIWDTMLAAHAIDNRKGVVGVKFQAFSLLGYPAYDTVAKYFKSDSANLANQIRQAPIKDLLKYNALDCILEYKIAMMQRGNVDAQANQSGGRSTC